MEFRKILVMRGPNIWSKHPVLEAWVDLGNLKDSPSNEMSGFNDRVMTWLPGMIEHECSIGTRGGFFERLRRGTYLAHILEHVTLELQTQAGSQVGFGRARETTTEGLFRVAFRYEEEAIGRAALELGRRLCLAAVYDQPFDIKQEIARLRRLADDARMGPTTQAMALAAKARGIPVRRLNDASLVLLGQGVKQHRIHRSATDRTGAVAEAISDDKQVTKDFLRSAGVSVAKGRLVTSPADAWAAAQAVGTPVVVKPKDANYGNGVVIGISGREQIEAAYEFALPQGNGVMVEQLAQGAEHRLLVVGGRFTAATRGNPAYVVGDGRQTIFELVQSQLNSDPRRGKDGTFPLAIIEFDPTVLLTLENEGFMPDSIPQPDQRVMIQRNGNLAVDVTDEVHPSVRANVEMAAKVLMLDVAGIDIIARDISRPLEEQGGVIIEVNAGPGLQMHTAPEQGQPRPVAEAIVATLYPAGQTGRIPIVAVVGESDAAETSARIARAMTVRGMNVGLAGAAGTTVGGKLIDKADGRGAATTQMLLMNPTVEAIVCETSIDRLAEEGVGFDRCQVAVLTSVGAGIRLDVAEWDTPEKQVMVHRTVSDVVLRDGYLVMPAGEPLGAHIIEKCEGQLVLFSLTPDDGAISEHLQARKRAVVAHGADIELHHAGQSWKVPCGGKPVSVALLAAVAGAWAAGVPIDQLGAAVA